jgi:hypothetical protein
MARLRPVGGANAVGGAMTASHRAMSRGLGPMAAGHELVHQADRETGTKGRKLCDVNVTRPVSGTHRGGQTAVSTQYFHGRI